MNAKEIEQEISERQYMDILDEAYGEVEICGMKYSSGYALKQLDETAFRCGKVDYEDTLDRKWECGECGQEFDDEDEANQCCIKEEVA